MKSFSGLADDDRMIVECRRKRRDYGSVRERLFTSLSIPISIKMFNKMGNAQGVIGHNCRTCVEKRKTFCGVKFIGMK